MAKRRTEASVKIERFTGLLKRKIELERVILFGSQVRGKQKRWSDIDLAVISDYFRTMDFHERLVFLGMLAWQAKATEIEALGYTVDEYENATKLDFLGEIKRTGKIIYDKGKE
jgi:predicted nucleotidyltransferase